MNMVVSTAAFAATATPVIAGNPDATIIAAAERLHELKPMYDAAQARWDETYAEFRTRRPERPRELKWRAPDGLNVGHWGGKERGGPWLDHTDLNRLRDVPQLKWKYVGPGHCMEREMWNDDLGQPKDEFMHLFDSTPDEIKQRRLNEAIAAMDIDNSRCAALKAEIGFDVAEKHLNDVYFNQVVPLEKIVIETEAQTIAGLRAKASVLIEWFYEDNDRDPEYEPNEYEKLTADVVNGFFAMAA